MKTYRKIINISSIIFLLALIIFYGYRLVYYYKLEHQPYSDVPVPIYQKLINSKGIEGTNYGLLKDTNGYIYGPKSTDNYLYYAGRLWRIIGIDENNNIKLITDESQTILTWEEDTTFKDSNIYTWLNNTEVENSGIFEKSLKETTSGNIKIGDGIVTLLTKEEYEKIGANSYLVDGNNFWINGDTRSYVNNKGEIITDVNDYDAMNVRPVIILNSSYNYISGNGTKENPYIIYNPLKEKLNSTYVGEYITYNNLLWRIIDTTDNIRVSLEGYVENEQTFSNNSNLFNIKDGIGNYLNGEYYQTLENNDYIVQNDYFMGSFNKDDHYSYLNTYSDKVNVYIGLPKVGDFFINSYDNYYTLTPSESSQNVIYVMNKNKRLFADFVTEKYQIRPVITLDSEIFILGGSGTKESPYEIGR